MSKQLDDLTAAVAANAAAVDAAKVVLAALAAKVDNPPAEDLTAVTAAVQAQTDALAAATAASTR